MRKGYSVAKPRILGGKRKLEEENVAAACEILILKNCYKKLQSGLRNLHASTLMSLLADIVEIPDLRKHLDFNRVVLKILPSLWQLTVSSRPLEKGTNVVAEPD